MIYVGRTRQAGVHLSMKNITNLSRDITQAQAKLVEAVSMAFAEAIRAACVQVFGHRPKPASVVAASVMYPKLKAKIRAKKVGVLTTMRIKTISGPPAVEYKLDLPDGRRYYGKRKRDLVRRARQLDIIFVEA